MPRLSLLPFRRKSFSRRKSGKYGNIDDDGDNHPLVYQLPVDSSGASQYRANDNSNYLRRSRSLSADSFRRKSHPSHAGLVTCRSCSCQRPTSDSGCIGARDKSDKRPSMLVWTGRKPKNARDYYDDSTDDSSVSNYRYNRRSPCDDIAVHLGDAVLNLVDGVSACLSIFHEDCGERTNGRSGRKKGRKSTRKVAKESSAPRKVTAEELRDDSWIRNDYSCQPLSCFGRDRNSPRTVATVESSESLDREDEEELDEFVHSRAKNISVINLEPKASFPVEEFADFTAAPMQTQEGKVRPKPIEFTSDQTLTRISREAIKAKPMVIPVSVPSNNIRETKKPSPMNNTLSVTVKPSPVKSTSSLAGKPSQMKSTSSMTDIQREPELHEKTEITYPPQPNELKKLNPTEITSSISAHPKQAGTSKLCAACGTASNEKIKLKLCSRCQIVYYCGSACQAKHWYEGHMHHCKAIPA